MRIRKLSLRVLLCSVLAFCFAFAIGANWYRSGLKQAQSVAALIQLSKETEKLGLDERVIILVYYDSDLVWLEDQGRYAPTFQEPARVSAWLRDNIGKNFFESPVAIEIVCDGTSKISDEMVAQINNLDSVKQVWISDMSHVDLSDSLIYENTRKLVSELFPEVIAEWLLPDGIIL